MNVNYEYKKLCPFKWFILENFPFIEADFDALTNWQLFCKLGEEMNKVIAKVNEAGQQVENVTNAFIDFSSDMTEKFNNLDEDLTIKFQNLQNFVNNFFDTLDVQEEINNKLDEMVQDGTLSEIINNYTQVTKVYNTISDMINDAENLFNNMKVKTLGYYTINDGGGAYYYITDSTSSGSFQIAIGNLYATLISNNYVNVKQLGAKGDGINDDADSINNAITYFSDIYIPNGTYVVSTGFTMKNNLRLRGENNTTIVQKDDSNITNIFTCSNKNNVVIENIKIDLNIENQNYNNRDNQGRGILVTSSNDIKIINFNTDKIYGTFVYIVDSNYISIEKSTIKDPDGAYSAFGIYLVRCQHATVDHCRFEGVREYGTALSTYGIQAKDSCLDVVVQNCYFYQMQCIIDGSKTNGQETLSSSCKIINNLLINTGGDTTIRYCKFGLIANNITRNSGDFGISVGDSEFVNVCNNIVDNSNTVGIGIRKSSQCTVNNNTISNPCSNFRNLSLVENQRDGIYVLGNSRRVNVCNNTIIDTKTLPNKMYSGIRIEDVSGGVSGADDSFAVICNNTIYGASQLSNQIVSVSTKNVVANNLLQQ